MRVGEAGHRVAEGILQQISAVADLLSGQAHVMFANISDVLPQVKAGKLRALAVTTAKRSAVVPELPTLAEAGVTDFEASTWQAVLAPAGTPRAIVDRLAKEVSEVLQQAEMRETFATFGVAPSAKSPDEFAEFIREEAGRWGALVKASGITGD